MFLRFLKVVLRSDTKTTWDGLIIQEKKLSVKWEDEKIR